jgi:hypothetical protein
VSERSTEACPYDLNYLFHGNFIFRRQDISEQIYCVKLEIGDAIGTHGQVAALVFHFVLGSWKLSMDLRLRSIPELSHRTRPAISASGYLSFSKYTHVGECPGGT